jgi:cytochrome c553
MNKLLTTVFAFAVASVTAFSAQAQEVKGDAKAGEKKIAMCIGCHGIKGYQASFPEVYKVPMISGQGAKYIVSALNAYKRGDRRHPTMGAIATSLSDQDMADVAAFYEQHGRTDAVLPAKPAREPSPAVAELLKKGACVSCHGDNFSKPIDPSYPKLAGQHGDYLYAALRGYKFEGHRTWGRNNAIMAGVDKQFSLPELKLLTAYVSSLDGELKTVPQAKFK